MQINPICVSNKGLVYEYKYGTFKVLTSSVKFHFGGARGSSGAGSSGSVSLFVTPTDQQPMEIKFDFDLGNTDIHMLSVSGVAISNEGVSRPIAFRVPSPEINSKSGVTLVMELSRMLLNDYIGYCYNNSGVIPVSPDFKPLPTQTLRECAFIWLYSSEDLTCHKSDELVPFIMTFTRWDGKLGTIGGKLEAGETPVQGAMREAKEELSESFGSHPLEIESNLQRLCTFLDERSGVLIHSFAMCLPYERLIDLSNRFFTEKLTQKRELCGISFVPCTNYYNPRNNEVVGIDSYLKNEFSATAKLELRSLIGNLKCRNILRHD